MSIGVNVRHKDHNNYRIDEPLPGQLRLNIVCDGLPIVQISLENISRSEADRLAEYLQAISRFVMTPDIQPELQAFCDGINAARDRAAHES